MKEQRLSIDELADLGGVSRRTVRYYIQEGLLPKPLGVGRGRHYDRSHLERLLYIKDEQQAGRSLDEIRSKVADGEAYAMVPERRGPLPAPMLGPGPVPMPAMRPPIGAQLWRRLEVAPGVELHISEDSPLLTDAHRLARLLAECIDRPQSTEQSQSLRSEGEE